MESSGESARDLLKAAKLEPKNAAVRAEYEKTRKAVADAKKKEKATYGSMFSKIEFFDDAEIAKKKAADKPAYDSESDDDEEEVELDEATRAKMPGIRSVDEPAGAGSAEGAATD